MQRDQTMSGENCTAWEIDVWQSLDRKLLADLAQRVPSVLFATVSGAHLYGFASADSDIDLRGVFLLPISAMVGLSEPRETLTAAETLHGIELDLVVHDLRKFARMMTRHNGYALEQLYSPLVVTGGKELEELREIGRGCLTRGLYRHYRGFAHGRRKLLNEPGATVKHLLYAYRVYMTGIRALRGGGIESNIAMLNEEFSLGQIDELVARKRTGAERQRLQADELITRNQELDRLELELQAAFDKSKLPEEATTLRELNDFIVRIRLNYNLGPLETGLSGTRTAEPE